MRKCEQNNKKIYIDSYDKKTIYQISIYIENLYVQTKIMIRTKIFPPLQLQFY